MLIIVSCDKHSVPRFFTNGHLFGGWVGCVCVCVGGGGGFVGGREEKTLFPWVGKGMILLFKGICNNHVP